MGNLHPFVLHILVGENLCPQVQQHCMLPLAKICPAVFIVVSQLILRPVRLLLITKA